MIAAVPSNFFKATGQAYEPPHRSDPTARILATSIISTSHTHSPVSTTIATAPTVSTPQSSELFSLPWPPTWLIIASALFAILGFCMAFLVYLLNFPPAPFRQTFLARLWHNAKRVWRRRRRQRKTRHGHFSRVRGYNSGGTGTGTESDGGDQEHEMLPLPTGRSTAFSSPSTGFGTTVTPRRRGFPSDSRLGGQLDGQSGHDSRPLSEAEWARRRAAWDNDYDEEAGMSRLGSNRRLGNSVGRNGYDELDATNDIQERRRKKGWLDWVDGVFELWTMKLVRYMEDDGGEEGLAMPVTEEQRGSVVQGWE